MSVKRSSLTSFHVFLGLFDLLMMFYRCHILYFTLRFTTILPLFTPHRMLRIRYKKTYNTAVIKVDVVKGDVIDVITKMS